MSTRLGDGSNASGLSAAAVDALAQRLLAAERERKPVAPLTDEHPDIGAGGAYRIQLAIIEHKVAAGARIVGRKVGLTSKAMMDWLKVTEPDYGHLLDTMAIPDGGAVRTSELIQPRAEPEIAFIFGRDLGGRVTAAHVLDAVRYVIPALEIIDSRIADWKIKLGDTIADNGSSARFVLGGPPIPLDGVDLRKVGVVFEKNGDIVSTAAGAAVMGQPVEAVAWLVRKVTELGGTMRAGDVVLSGALTGATELKPGDRVRCTIDRLGTVSATVS